MLIINTSERSMRNTQKVETMFELMQMANTKCICFEQECLLQKPFDFRFLSKYSLSWSSSIIFLNSIFFEGLMNGFFHIIRLTITSSCCKCWLIAEVFFDRSDSKVSSGEIRNMHLSCDCIEIMFF